MKYIRIWNKVNIDNVKKYLIIIDDIYGYCANCKELNLKYTEHKNCPACKTQFKYITSKLTSMTITKKILNRIDELNLELQFIEKKDYDEAFAKDALSDLFS